VSSTSVIKGDGGAGVSSSVTGSSITRAGGGGGGQYISESSGPGAGGSGGGGAGGTGSGGTGTAGTVNTGGGGGGGGNSGNGGAGGKGLVVLRTSDTTSNATVVNATVTQSGGYYIYTFNDSGTIKWGA
jgi:hypothetical protein